jgi:hypothetical protein
LALSGIFIRNTNKEIRVMAIKLKRSRLLQLGKMKRPRRNARKRKDLFSKITNIRSETQIAGPVRFKLRLKLKVITRGKAAHSILQMIYLIGIRMLKVEL